MTKLENVTAYEFARGDDIPEWLLELIPNPRFKSLGRLVWGDDALVIYWRGGWQVLSSTFEVEHLVNMQGSRGVILHATDHPVRLHRGINQLTNCNPNPKPFDWRSQKDT